MCLPEPLQKQGTIENSGAVLLQIWCSVPLVCTEALVDGSLLGWSMDIGLLHMRKWQSIAHLQPERYQNNNAVSWCVRARAWGSNHWSSAAFPGCGRSRRCCLHLSKMPLATSSPLALSWATWCEVSTVLYPYLLCCPQYNHAKGTGWVQSRLPPKVRRR